jgi:ketosteroid isomerase-like protein
MRIVTLALAAVLLASSTPALAQDPAEAEVSSLIERWAEARVNGDAAFLEQFYAEELRIGQANGGLIDREDDIALFAAREIKPEYIRDTDMTVRVYGDTAVVECIESLKGTYRGTPGEMSLRMLNVLTRRDGRWQLVASQSALVRD